MASLIIFGVVYLLIFSFGTLYVYRLLEAGPSAPEPALPTIRSVRLPSPGGSPVAGDEPEGGGHDPVLGGARSP